jgi:hypothetical protein
LATAAAIERQKIERNFANEPMCLETISRDRLKKWRQEGPPA